MVADTPDRRTWVPPPSEEYQASHPGWDQPAEPPAEDWTADVPPPDEEEQHHPGPDQPDPARTRPLIQIKAGMLAALTDAAEDALLAAGAEVFQRAETLVRPGTSEVPAADGRTTIAAGLHSLAASGLREEMGRAADWQSYDGRSKEWRTVDPPGLIANALAARKGQWRLRNCTGVITCPTLRPDCWSWPSLDTIWQRASITRRTRTS